MYETITANLGLLTNFLILGFLLSFLYEFLRIFRIFLPHSSFWVNLEDFLFLTFAGVVTFAYSLEFGTGEFRFIFIVSELIGGSIYFLTVGAIISFLTKKFADAIKFLIKKIINLLILPILKSIVKFMKILFLKLAKINNNFIKVTKNTFHPLKYKIKMMYNSKSNSKNRIVKENMEGSKNVIRAKITKKT